jgi:hypothetical protein
MSPDPRDAPGYQGQAVISNNIVYASTCYAWGVFYHADNTSTPTIKLYNNTFFADLTNVGADGADGEIHFNCARSCTSLGWPITVQHNIAYNPNATSNGHPNYAAVVGGQTWTGLTYGGTGFETVLEGSAATCAGACDAGKNVSNFNSNGLGTQIYANQTFTNPSDLLFNRARVPSCGSFPNTT